MASVESIKASVASASAHFGRQAAAAIFQVRAEPQAPFLEQKVADFNAGTSSQIASAYGFPQAAMPLLTYAGGSTEFPVTMVYVGVAGASRSGMCVLLKRSGICTRSHILALQTSLQSKLWLDKKQYEKQ